VQVREHVALGELDPEHVVTPGIFVQRVVRIGDAGVALVGQAGEEAR
jgi:3-oxoadipate CoA-transferase alpha subunit